MPLNLNCLRQSQIKLNFARVKKRSNSNVSTCSLYIFLYYQTNPQIVTLINHHYWKTGMFFFHEAETLPLTFFLNFSAAAKFSQKSFKPRNENKGSKNFTSFLFSFLFLSCWILVAQEILWSNTKHFYLACKILELAEIDRKHVPLLTREPQKGLLLDNHGQDLVNSSLVGRGKGGVNEGRPRCRVE